MSGGKLSKGELVRGEIVQGGTCPGGNCPKWNLSGGILSDCKLSLNLSERNFSNFFPVTSAMAGSIVEFNVKTRRV